MELEFIKNYLQLLVFLFGLYLNHWYYCFAKFVRLRKDLAIEGHFSECLSLFREFNQSYEYKSVSLVQEILLN